MSMGNMRLVAMGMEKIKESRPALSSSYNFALKDTNAK